MFTTGVVLLPFFSLMTYLISVPTGVKFFNWIATMWRGHIRFDTPMLYAVGFLITFLGGGLSGMLLAAPPLDFFEHDTYFVVAHFHNVVMALFLAAVGALVYWYPKMTGRMMREGIGKISFWFMFIGANVTFIPQYILGLRGMPRRIVTYPPGIGWHFLNELSTIGSFMIAVGALFLVINFWVSWRKPISAGNDPWDGHTLEWYTTSPPPHHNFDRLPIVRSERPVWDVKYGLEGAAIPGHSNSNPPSSVKDKDHADNAAG
jgi:cytochrome c oxidase subunit 1